MNRNELSYFIGVDVGTQGIRTGIIDNFGKTVTQNEVGYETFYPEIGWAEQNPKDWWDGFMKSINLCLQDTDKNIISNIKSICVCATSSTVIPVDENGDPLMNGLLWMDSRSHEEVKLINETNSDVLKYCGGEVSVEWMIPKTLWIKRNRRKIYDKAYKVVEELDFFNYKFTGKWVSSRCNATCKWNYIESLGGWDEEFFKSIGLEDYKEKIPTDVKKIGDIIGTLNKELASELGLNEDVVIVQGGIDAHIAMLGMGAVEPGKMATIMGTSFVHLALAQNPIFQKGIWGPYDKAMIEDYWLLEGGQISAGSITKWFVEEFGIDSETAYIDMSEAASKIPIGSEGVVVLDFFQGNRTPYKDSKAKGIIYGLNLKHTKDHIYRAILESIAFGTRNIIDNFKNQGHQVTSIVGCGGVTKNEIWLQIISDVVGIPIIVNENIYGGILGCCVASSVALNVYDNYVIAAEKMVHAKKIVNPVKENYNKYQDNYENYIQLYQSLKDMMKK